MIKWSFLTSGCLLGVLNPLTREPVEATSLGGPSHIGTFEGSTTFTEALDPQYRLVLVFDF